MTEKTYTNWQDNADAMLETFSQDGFVALPEFLNPAEVKEVEDNLNRFIVNVVPTMPRNQVFYEDLDRPDSLKQIQQMYLHDTFFKNLFLGSKFEQLAEILMAGPVDGKNMQYFNKPAGIGKATPPHQDGYYFMLKPCEAITMWLALDEVDEENGCIRYVRGSNHLGLRPHGRTNTLGFSQGVTDYGTADDMTNEVAFSAKPGDLLAHHAMTIHRADGNQSQTRTRRALGFIYYAERAKEDTAAHEAYQRKLAEEMAKSGKI